MRIPRKWIKAYSDSLNEISEQARASLEQALSQIDYAQDVAIVREQVVGIMQTCCGASSTVAAGLAADFYDGLRGQFGIADGFAADVEPCREADSTEGAVRAFAQDLVDGKPVEQFVGKCADRLDRETRLAANKCVEHNAKRDPKKPKWARIPTGVETCKFCIMLASRGFEYNNKELASHAHANCDCRVVPSWNKDEAEVEGYDPDYYRRIWRRLDGAVTLHDDLYSGTPSAIKRECDEINHLISKAWNEYLDDGGTPEAYQRTVGKYIEGMSRSGRLSIEPKVDIKRRGHEAQLASWFADAGHDVSLRRPRNDKDTNDSLIDQTIWEFKRLTTKSTKKFNRRITEKIPRQGPNFIVDLSAGGLDRDTAEFLIADLLEDANIEQIILVKGGSAKLFVK